MTFGRDCHGPRRINPVSEMQIMQKFTQIYISLISEVKPSVVSRSTAWNCTTFMVHGFLMMTPKDYVYPSTCPLTPAWTWCLWNVGRISMNMGTFMSAWTYIHALLRVNCNKWPLDFHWTPSTGLNFNLSNTPVASLMAFPSASTRLCVLGWLANINVHCKHANSCN